MRPDEHKKKQRAKYKKEHGISNKRTPSKGKQETLKDGDNVQVQDEKVSAYTDEIAQSQFSRRKVSSNWDRYEDLEDTSDEDDSGADIQQRGEDYNVLLQRSANPASQFRFQSEKDWDQETDPSATQVTVSALEVDFGALAASLNSVPLHKRLNICADNLHPDLVHKFKMNAQIYQKPQSVLSWSSTNETDSNTVEKTQPNPKDSHTPWKSLQSNQTEQHNVIKITSRPSSIVSKQPHGASKSDKDSLQAKVTGAAVEPLRPHSVEEIQTSLKDVFKTVNTSSTKSTTGKVVDSVNHEEDELDFLLSLETPSVNNSGVASSGNNAQKANPSPEVTSSVKPNTQPLNSADDNLEDWLDSVLG